VMNLLLLSCLCELCQQPSKRGIPVTSFYCKLSETVMVTRSLHSLLAVNAKVACFCFVSFGCTTVELVL
jgi:hypothetical protein